MKKEHIPLLLIPHPSTFILSQFRGQDLNLRPPGYEPGELPLLHPGIKSHSGSAFAPSRLRALHLLRGSRRGTSRRGSGSPLASAMAFEDARRSEFT